MHLKKFIIVLSTLMSFSLCACNNLPDPFDGDMGGGGEGKIPQSVYDEKKEERITNAALNVINNAKQLVRPTETTTLTKNKISEDGSYLITGEFTSGISIAEGLTVNLVIKDANISNNEGVAISSKKNCNVNIFFEGNNTLTSSEDENGIHIKGNLYIAGSGKAIINAGKNGIKCSKHIEILGSELNITSLNNAIASESVLIKNANIVVKSSSKDAIQAELDYDNPDDESQCVFTLENGYVVLKDTTYKCSSYGDGIQADTFVYIDGGNVNITTIGNWVNKTNDNIKEYGLSSDDFKWIKNGDEYKRIALEDVRRYQASNLYALTQSNRGIKVGAIAYDTNDDGEDDKSISNGDYAIIINSGTFSFDVAEDGIHTNYGDIYINGGDINISSLDDGITSNYLARINGPNLNITKSYEGIEGNEIEIIRGNVNITSSDDGINAANADSRDTKYILLNGGNVFVDAQGDGLDSNGSIYINGANLTVYGPTSGGDGGLDSETGIIINKGEVFVTSARGMTETPSSNSVQYVLYLGLTGNANSVVKVLDNKKNVVFEKTVTKAYGTLTASSYLFKKGETYDIYVNDSLNKSITISNIITSADISGGGSRPGGNPPGGNPRP